MLSRCGQQQRPGGPLLAKVRSQGSVLSSLDKKLLWAERMRVERLGPQSLNTEVSDEIGRLITPARRGVRIQASYKDAVAALMQTLADAQMPMDIRYRDNVDAIASLLRSECDLAGFHLPFGCFRSVCVAVYRPWLDDGHIYWCI